MEVLGRNETFLFVWKNREFKSLSPCNAEDPGQIANFVVHTFQQDFIGFSCNVCILILTSDRDYLWALVYASLEFIYFWQRWRWNGYQFRIKLSFDNTCYFSVGYLHQCALNSLKHRTKTDEKKRKKTVGVLITPGVTLQVETLSVDRGFRHRTQILKGFISKASNNPH